MIDSRHKQDDPEHPFGSRVFRILFYSPVLANRARLRYEGVPAACGCIVTNDIGAYLTQLGREAGSEIRWIDFWAGLAYSGWMCLLISCKVVDHMTERDSLASFIFSTSNTSRS